MRKLSISAVPLLVVVGSTFSGCQDQTTTVPLRSLSRSGDVSYICREGGRGVPLDQCHRRSILRGERDLIALVTQTSTGEVALVNVPVNPNDPARDEGVIDVDPSLPGYNFLRVGGRPGDILSTPDGQASFVTATDVQKPGIFGLPTSCLGPPTERQTIRDVTTWPACSLPSAPGQMELVLDAGNTCGSAPIETDLEAECPVTLTEPGGGRWKLLVSLPASGSVAVIDALWLLSQGPGTYPACQLEAEYPLAVNLPSTPPVQELPEDLVGCTPAPLPTREAPPALTARPAALAGADGVLYAADESSPVIHRLDVTRPCAAAEMPPLLPRSFENPDRTVTAASVAVSPLTPSGKRFVYAVDQTDLPLSSVMVFDVSPGSNNRTPLLRPGSTYIPSETPDRLRFAGAVQDITFVYRDTPLLDEDTGTAVLGERCSPLPDPENALSGTKYQPDEDFLSGARASELRGVFAVALLSTGEISVVDVEDLDAACRRPASINRSSTMDFRGCVNDAPADPALESYVDGDGPTVTDEVSCRMVQPHRPRSAYVGVTNDDVGTRAPALRGFPVLDVPSTALGRSREQLPKLLAVDIPGVSGSPEPAQVYVGTSLYRRNTGTTPSVFDLEIDPASAERHSLVLPFVEPRAYLSEAKALVYEGVVAGSSSGAIALREDGTAVLSDGSNYCDRGVHDVEVMRELGAERFGLSGQELERFASAHADKVVIVADFPEADDAYWAGGRACSRAECEQVFGEADADLRLPTRDFSIVDADQRSLLLSGEELPRAACCFPAGFEYTVRASQQWVLTGEQSLVQHDITAVRAEDGSFECVRDCNPRKRWNVSRVFEVSCDGPSCGFGAATPADPDSCVVPGALPEGLPLDQPAARCIHDTPTARFAVYRGLQPSERDMTFLWDVAGAFRPLSLDLSGISQAVLPQSAVALRDLDWLTIVDGASLGLVVVDLNQLQIETPTIN